MCCVISALDDETLEQEEYDDITDIANKVNKRIEEGRVHIKLCPNILLCSVSTAPVMKVFSCYAWRLCSLCSAYRNSLVLMFVCQWVVCRLTT